MAVVIRLQRTGKPKQAHFRLVAIERGRGATGKPLEVLGSYNPRGEAAAKKLELRRDRYEAWLKKGALPSETVSGLVQAAFKTAAAPAAEKQP
ncbi:MAG: 30S ribosomal protein S16 [Elusimicrobia bacterium]|nr:30S ribosomal protein S16 [Elusimicrobiota bacterium]